MQSEANIFFLQSYPNASHSSCVSLGKASKLGNSSLQDLFIVKNLDYTSLCVTITGVTTTDVISAGDNFTYIRLYIHSDLSFLLQSITIHCIKTSYLFGSNLIIVDTSRKRLKDVSELKLSSTQKKKSLYLKSIIVKCPLKLRKTKNHHSLQFSYLLHLRFH